MTFNLDPPPGFKGFDPDQPIEIYTRNLPHWRQPGATYFVTFCLGDAIPGPKKAQLKSMRRDWEHQNPPPRDEAKWAQHAREVFRTVEKWMDAGCGKCWLRKQEHASELQRSILHYHLERYEVGCFVIMANHCHLIMRPFDEIKLESEVGAIKSVVSRFINQHESISGSLWQQESHDRIIRDEEHLYRVVQYIGANPAKAGIPEPDWYRWINPDWEKLGWRFEIQVGEP